jgi:hypothetical protein
MIGGLSEFEAFVERARRVPIEELAARRNIKLKKQGAELVGPCPVCNDGDDRFSINITEQLFNCRFCKRGGKGGIAFIKFLDRCEFVQACETVTGEPAPKSKPNGKDQTVVKPKKKVVERFDYLDEGGTLLFQVERVESQNQDGSFVLTAEGKRKKTFWQRRPDRGRPDEWIYNLDGVRPVPYRLEELLEALAKNNVIFIVEGEGKVDLLRSWNIPATCCAGGAGKWLPEHSAFLRGANVVILSDNDEAGRNHESVVGASLHGIAASVRVLDLPGLPLKGDVRDWAAAGHTADELWRLVESEAKPWVSGDKTDEALDRVNPEEIPDEFLAFWHGDVVPADSRPWLVYGTLPEVGAGLLSGQWGTYKTFTAIDIACAVMSRTPIFGSEVDRQGGVVLHAAEGAPEVPIRLEAAIKNRSPSMAKAPFAWLTPEKLPLNLLDPKSVQSFIERLQKIDAEMKMRFNLPLVLIIIDTLVATAGFKNSGDEDDAVLGARLMKQGVGEISRKTGAFVLCVDHFGKNAETGTRGTSAKEDNVDVILATLGQKSIAGVVPDPRLVVRKVRGGVQGREYAFATSIVDTGVVDSKRRPITTLVIKWSEQTSPSTPGANDIRNPWPKSLRLLRKVLMNILADHGSEQRPYPDGPMVQAVSMKLVRAEFYKEYPAGGDDETKRKAAKNKAFNRAIKDAKDRNVIGVREIDAVEYVWLV